MMTAVDLAIGEIEDVAKDAANRRAHGMKNPKRPVCGWCHALHGIGLLKFSILIKGFHGQQSMIAFYSLPFATRVKRVPINPTATLIECNRKRAACF
jgi:hypothetical protein